MKVKIYGGFRDWEKNKELYNYDYENYNEDFYIVK